MISCLMSTYGRHSLARIALAGWMSQLHEDRELVILNQHPVPMSCDVPGVRVFNEQLPNLAESQNRLFDLAEGEFSAIWDDDDVYLPFHLVTAVIASRGVPKAAAWRPARAYHGNGVEKAELVNLANGEATWMFRTEKARGRGVREDMDVSAAFAMPVVTYDLEPTFLYIWNNGSHHLSGSFGSGTIADRIKAWRAANDDHGSGVALTPDFDRYNAAIESVL